MRVGKSINYLYKILLKPSSGYLYKIVEIWYLFAWRDLLTTITPGMLFSLVAFYSTWSSGNTVSPMKLLDVFIYLIFYQFTFNLLNQAVGYEEDRINKPDRPIPRGLISVEKTYLVFMIFSILFMVVGWYYNVVHWNFMWIIINLSYHFGGLHKHWFGKNFVMIPTGALALLAPAWEIITPTTDVSWNWMLTICIWIGPSVQVQDLRDTDGDRAIGRKTLPIWLGDEYARYVICIFFLLSPVFLWYKYVDRYHNPGPILMILIFLIFNTYLAWRVLMFRSPSKDHDTYQLWSVLSCVIVFSSIFLV